MINIKYYLILLIGVFLSLGTGTIIGVSIQNKEVLENQHSILVNRLEDEFNGIRDENRRLKEELNLLIESKEVEEKKWGLIHDSLVKDKLNGLEIAFIKIGDENDYSWLISLLESSGASLAPIITFNKSLFTIDQSTADKIVESANVYSSDIGFYGEISQEFVKSIAMGTYNPYSYILKEQDLVDSPIDIKGECDVIVLAYNDDPGGINTRAKFCEQLMVTTKAYTIPIIVVELDGSKDIDIIKCKTMGISTIDHINTLYGSFTLLSLLRGDKGNFGQKSGTEGLIPDVLFPLETQYSDADEIKQEEP